VETGRVGSGRVAVLLDTNMLMLLADGVRVLEDIESQLECAADFLCPESVVFELQEMARAGKSGWRKAEWVLSHIDKICKVVESVEKRADTDLILLASSLKKQGRLVVVATNDRELRKKLREVGIASAYLVESEMRVECDL